MRPAVWILLVAVGVGLGTPLVVAQPTAQTYDDPACGYRFVYPGGWRAGKLNDARGLAWDGQTPPTFLIAGPIVDVRAGQVSPEALALAAAGAYCLDCLRDTLVWLERFTSGTKTVTYTISRNTQTFDNVRYAGYLLDFFVFDDGVSRGLGAGGFTRAEVVAWIPDALLLVMEPVITTIVRTLQFSAAREVCWR